MGTAISLHCNKCGREKVIHFGTGFLFQQTYSQTIKDMKQGAYGELGQRFFAEHPQGTVDCEQVALVCGNCNRLVNGVDMTMYIPKPSQTTDDGQDADEDIPNWKENTFVMPSEIKQHFIEYAKFNHECHKCHSLMTVMKQKLFEDRLNKCLVKCPECGEPMEQTEILDCE